MPNVMSVALTGASGFVGGHVLSNLLAAGHKVQALVRRPDRFNPRVADAKLQVIEGSLTHEAALARLVHGADAVIHVVGIIMENRRNGQTFEQVHTQSTKRLIAAAGQAGVGRWVQVSALGTRPDAVSTYHRTKWDAEQAVRDCGLSYTIVRPSLIHGPDGEFMQMVKGFWCKFMPPFVPYFGAGPFGTGGAGRLQPVWVEDVARCCCDALSNDKTVNETYPMGGPDVYTWPTLYQTCARHLPGARKKRIIALPAWKAKILAQLPGTPFNWDQVIMSQEDSVCDIGKVQTDFGFEVAPFEPTFADYAAQI